uniref:Interferon gamma n=1 Tax=Scleropages formosus TaxID=113540 RepID=A0A8C9WLQ2_SCLFO
QFALHQFMLYLGPHLDLNLCRTRTPDPLESWTVVQPTAPPHPPHLKQLFPFFSWQEGSQKLLVNEILDTYIVILSTLRNQTKDKDVQLSIAAVTGRIENLKSHFLKNNDLKKKLQNLWAIKTGDAIVQRKALLELMAVFQKASKLNSRIQERKQNRRKRRQVRRTRIHSV